MENEVTFTCDSQVKNQSQLYTETSSQDQRDDDSWFDQTEEWLDFTAATSRSSSVKEQTSGINAKGDCECDKDADETGLLLKDESSPQKASRDRSNVNGNDKDNNRKKLEPSDSGKSTRWVTENPNRKFMTLETENKKGFAIIPKPTQVLRLLGEYEYSFREESWTLKDEFYVSPFQTRNVRVVIIAEKLDAQPSVLRGIGEADNLKFAEHSAALNLCEEIQEKHQAILPEMIIPDDVRLSSEVFSALYEISEGIQRKIQKIKYKLGNGPQLGVRSCIASIGNRRAVGIGCNAAVAKLLAAYKLFRFITGKPFPLGEIVKGKDCSSGFDRYTNVSNRELPLTNFQLPDNRAIPSGFVTSMKNPKVFEARPESDSKNLTAKVKTETTHGSGCVDSNSDTNINSNLDALLKLLISQMKASESTGTDDIIQEEAETKETEPMSKNLKFETEPIHRIKVDVDADANRGDNFDAITEINEDEARNDSIQEETRGKEEAFTEIERASKKVIDTDEETHSETLIIEWIGSPIDINYNDEDVRFEEAREESDPGVDYNKFLKILAFILVLLEMLVYELLCSDSDSNY